MNDFIEIKTSYGQRALIRKSAITSILETEDKHTLISTVDSDAENFFCTESPYEEIKAMLCETDLTGYTKRANPKFTNLFTGRKNKRFCSDACKQMHYRGQKRSEPFTTEGDQ